MRLGCIKTKYLSTSAGHIVASQGRRHDIFRSIDSCHQSIRTAYALGLPAVIGHFECNVIFTGKLINMVCFQAACRIPVTKIPRIGADGTIRIGGERSVKLYYLSRQADRIQTRPALATGARLPGWSTVTTNATSVSAGSGMALSINLRLPS